MLPKFKRPNTLTVLRVGTLAFYALLFIFLPNINNLSRRKASRLCPDNQTSVNTELNRASLRISFGEQNLISDKQLQDAQVNTQNNPEKRIYDNNKDLNAENSYTIAVSVPITGNTEAALEILRGVAQAQDQFNKLAKQTKANGLKIEIADDNNKPDIAKQIAYKLVNQPEVLGVIGHFGSQLTQDAGAIYCGELVTISPTSTSVKLIDRNPYIFTTVPSDAVAARALANYMVNTLKQKKATVFYNHKKLYSDSLATEFKTAVALEGGEVANEIMVSDESAIVSDPLTQAINAGAKVLMLAPIGDDFSKALEVVQANKKRLILLGGDSVYKQKTLKDSGELAKEMVIAVPWHQDIDSESTTIFLNQAEKLWVNKNVNWRTALAYDATQAFIEALKKIDKSNPTRVEIQQKLSERGFSADGASGPIRFLPSGERNASFQLVKVCPNPKKNSEYKFVPIQKLKQPDKCDT
jgi:branched-chain amino acid transport system substrate-binding protein